MFLTYSLIKSELTLILKVTTQGGSVKFTMLRYRKQIVGWHPLNKLNNLMKMLFMIAIHHVCTSGIGSF